MRYWYTTVSSSPSRSTFVVVWMFLEAGFRRELRSLAFDLTEGRQTTPFDSYATSGLQLPRMRVQRDVLGKGDSDDLVEPVSDRQTRRWDTVDLERLFPVEKRTQRQCGIHSGCAPASSSRMGHDSLQKDMGDPEER
jgi:hypothetical protein